MTIVTAGIMPASILVTGRRPKWLRDRALALADCAPTLDSAPDLARLIELSEAA